MVSGKLVFGVNGERFQVESIDPSTTLLEFLRTKTRFKSVKLGCGEGGCGACVVLLSKYDPVTDKVEDYTVNSCLTLVCSINGCSITTSEGLGNCKQGFHAIHQRIAGFHGTQCGFCTPGMCVSLFSALVNAEKSDKTNASPGFSKLSVAEAQKAISGNLCRCTGYRPIADACQSFAGDVDIEDLGYNCFWNKEESKDVKLGRLPAYDPNGQIPTYPEFLKNELKSDMILDSGRYSWYSPVSIVELQKLMESNEISSKTCVKFVVSNTGSGYFKELTSYHAYIDLRQIPELSAIKWGLTGVQIGAAVSISKTIATLKDSENLTANDGNMMIFRKIGHHFEKIASGSIRNSASIGGNLVMAQRSNFPSDIATVLLAVDAQIEVLNNFKYETISIEEFLERPPLDDRSIVVSVKIPTWQLSQSDCKLMFETYRASPRPLGNALAYLNAAFLAEVRPKSTDGFEITSIRLAFGAYGTSHAIRAKKAEEFFIGKTLDHEVSQEAMKLVQDIVVPEDGISHPSYRQSLAEGFLFEFLQSLVEKGSEISSARLNGYIDSQSETGSRAKQVDLLSDLPVLTPSKQVIGSSSEFHPVGQPIAKAGANLQASGEAMYVDDIPSPTDCLYGAFVYSTKPLARVKGVHFGSESRPDGVVDVITFKDIPQGGVNVGAQTHFGTETLFADDLTRTPGDRIALVVADTQKHADIAAELAVVDYDTENLEPPILTVEDAVARSSFFQCPPFLSPKPVGDFSKGMTEAEHKILSAEVRLPSQYYFYMETQAALAVPDEDKCMLVYSSCQAPEYTHSVIAKCLGVPENNVRIITRRVGGGFGGKALKSMPIAAACAVAAHKLQRPVRMYLTRKTDMIMAGGRHPMKATYNVGFKSDGKITAFHMDLLIDAGITEDISPLQPRNILGALKKYNWGNLSFDIKICKTNQISRSAMRAPGDVQGSFIAETVIEHVASALSLDVDVVRNKNLHTYDSLTLFYGHEAGELNDYTLPSLWDKITLSSSYNQRLELVKQFNDSHVWKKRGICRLPMLYEVQLRPTPGKVSILHDGSIVVEVGGIELGQGLWTKVKQVVAYGLSLVQCDGTDELLDKIRVIQTDTLSMVQGGFTAGSTTSESSSEAARLCCNTLVERLIPVKNKLQEQMGTVHWGKLIAQANMQAVSLSASAFYAPNFMSSQYLNYGAAVSEVEVNLVTGETSILRSDIVYDCGQSLNPAVDLGQIEGSFVQGIGFFMLEEYLQNPDGLITSEGTWSYKIPTVDTIPKQFNVEIVNSGHHKNHILSSKASGEPPLLLAASVHCATRAAIREARKQVASWGGLDENENANVLSFQLSVPATMPVVKELCGLDVVQRYLKSANGIKSIS